MTSTDYAKAIDAIPTGSSLPIGPDVGKLTEQYSAKLFSLSDEVAQLWSQLFAFYPQGLFTEWGHAVYGREELATREFPRNAYPIQEGSYSARCALQSLGENHKFKPQWTNDPNKKEDKPSAIYFNEPKFSQIKSALFAAMQDNLELNGGEFDYARADEIAKTLYFVGASSTINLSVVGKGSFFASEGLSKIEVKVMPQVGARLAGPLPQTPRILSFMRIFENSTRYVVEKIEDDGCDQTDKRLIPLIQRLVKYDLSDAAEFIPVGLLTLNHLAGVRDFLVEEVKKKVGKASELEAALAKI